MKPQPSVATNMSLDVPAAIENGLTRTATQTGAILIGLFIAVGLAVSVAMNSLMVTLFTETFDLREVFAESPDITYEEFAQQIQSSAPLDLIDAPASVLVGLILLAMLVQVVIRIGAIRWFVEERRGALRAELFTRRLLWTVGNLVVGAILFGALVFVAPLLVTGIAFVLHPLLGVLVLLVALVVMIFLTVALYFYNYQIVVEGSNALNALAESWTLTEGNRLMLFFLGFVFVVVGGIVGGGVGLAVGFNLLLSTVVSQVVNALIGVATIAVAADAFNQLRGKPDESAEAMDPHEL